MSEVLFEATPKQQQFIEKAFDDKYTFITYGGSAGGGKTFVSLATLILFCRFYPKSRWCIIRKSLTEIKLNTLPSFFKVCPMNFIQDYNKTEHTVLFKNGSQLLFKGENIDQDPELQWMDGLEVNGFLLEQVEELSQKCYDKAKLRAGRHIIPKQPPIKILMTLNPSQAWVKEAIYEPFTKGTIQMPYCYIPASINDNPYLTEEYKENLKYLDEITYRRYVEGDWTAFAVNNPFAYAFKPEKHIGKAEFNSGHHLHLSFDFNVDPITATARQKINNAHFYIKEFRIPNSDIYELCDRIKASFPYAVFLVTGDATGAARSAISKGNVTHYQIIKQKLNLNDTQIRVGTANPAVSVTRTLVNSILQNQSIIFDAENCPNLINDMKYVEVDNEGDIIKDRKTETRKADLMDCLRYDLFTFERQFLKM